MNQVKRKIKLVQSSSSKSKRGKRPQTSLSIQGEDLGSAEITSFWKQEIDFLESQRFESVSAAIDSLVDRVLVRLNVPEPQQQEVREYLVVLFATDPELQEELSSIVPIKL